MLTKRNPPVGARPGTLAIPPGSPEPRIRVFEYSGDSLEELEVQDPAALRRFSGTSATTWIDVQGMGDEGVLRQIAEIFGIHPLALEDAVNVPQRAKSELYDDHQIVIARAPLEEDGALDFPQVCFLVGIDYLVTFQDRYFGFFDPVRERIRAGIGPIRSGGPGYLCYALIDTLVDRYYPVVDAISEALDELEEVVLADAGTEDLARIHRLRRDIATLRRVGWPQRDSLQNLVRSPSPFLDDQVRVYLRDADDHMGQVMGRVDFCREIAVGLMDMYLSTASHRQNEIMKILTLMASIFIPLTFIAGIYGMNFEHMPELGRPGAYFTVLSVMGAVAVFMLIYFRRRGWLGRSRRRSRPGR
jgi:magnesium transporter